MGLKRLVFLFDMYTGLCTADRLEYAILAPPYLLLIAGIPLLAIVQLLRVGSGGF